MTPPARLTQIQRHLASTASSTAPHATTSSSTAPRPLPPSAQDYRFFLPMQTRWNDNDMYGHMNNAVYSFYFDSVTNAYLLGHAYPPPPAPHPIGLIVSSSTTYSASLAYPHPVVAALAVSKLGTRSVVWKVGLFAAEYVDPGVSDQERGQAEANEQITADPLRGFTLGDHARLGRQVRLVAPGAGDDPSPRAAAYGEMVHVFVDQESRKPVAELDPGMRAALQRLVVD